MTLYYYTLDTNGQSACYGGCAKAWPVFNAASLSVPSSLMASDFGTITRTDGTKQTTYKGWPLYYWFQDKMTGDMTGEGVHKVWYVLTVPAYTVMIGTTKAVGNYLVDGSGNTLYWFTKDSANTSACSGDCLKAWPAFTASSFVVPSALNASDFAHHHPHRRGPAGNLQGLPAVLLGEGQDARRRDGTERGKGLVRDRS